MSIRLVRNVPSLADACLKADLAARSADRTGRRESETSDRSEWASLEGNEESALSEFQERRGLTSIQKSDHKGANGLKRYVRRKRLGRRKCWGQQRVDARFVVFVLWFLIDWNGDADSRISRCAN